MHPLILNKGLDFQYNPFGGISDSELTQVIIPHSFTKEIHDLIHTENKLIIELVGAKGRGKTSHLKLIHQQYPNAPIFLLNGKNSIKNLAKITSKLIFIDSIHHLSLRQRLELFKKVNKIVLEDVRIYWQLIVKAYTSFGFSFKYKTEFTVTKEKLIP